jgi:putative transposase
LIWADGGYAGKLIDWVFKTHNWVLEIVKRNDDIKGFQVLLRRWVVERTLAWLSFNRQLSKDYEVLPENSEAMVAGLIDYIWTIEELLTTRVSSLLI